MVAIVVKVYRFGPGEVGELSLATSLQAALAADTVDSTEVVSFDMELVRGEVVYTVLHT